MTTKQLLWHRIRTIIADMNYAVSLIADPRVK
jgi:hypothetical protein